MVEAIPSPTLADVLESPEFASVSNQAQLAFAIGTTAGGQAAADDLTNSSVLLIAGPDGAGKSVTANAILCSLLMQYPPERLNLILFDPTGVELRQYRGIPHLLADVITKPEHARNALGWLTGLKSPRAIAFGQEGVRDIREFNDHDPPARMPYVVFVGDEMETALDADTESLIAQVAADSHSVGIHLILATPIATAQRLSMVLQHDRHSVLAFGALRDDRLVRRPPDDGDWPGAGSMLYQPPRPGFATRVQAAAVSDAVITAIASHWRKQGRPRYRPEIIAPPIGGTADDDEIINPVIERVLAEHPEIDPRITALHPRVRLIASTATDNGAIVACEVVNGEVIAWSGFEITLVAYERADGSTVGTVRKRFNIDLPPGDKTAIALEIDASHRPSASPIAQVGALSTISSVRTVRGWA